MHEEGLCEGRGVKPALSNVGGARGCVERSASPAGTLEQPSQASRGRCLLPGTPPLTQPRKLPQPFPITPSKMYIL